LAVQVFVVSPQQLDWMVAWPLIPEEDAVIVPEPV
jgi:hypothetical protein